MTSNIGDKVAYVTSPGVGVEIYKLYRLKAVSGSSAQKPEELLIPKDSIYQIDEPRKLVEPNSVLKPKEAVYYPTKSHLSAKDPWVLADS